jgi:hypothetical protein
MVSKSDARRYYLHKQIKKFADINATEYMVSITEKDLLSLKPKRKSYIDELKKSFGYSIQLKAEL